MTMMKAVSAAVLLSATLAVPAFAQEYVPAPYYAGPGPFYRSYGYGQVPGNYLPPRNTDEYWNLVNHGFTGRDPSRVGGSTPNVNPAGN